MEKSLTVINKQLARLKEIASKIETIKTVEEGVKTLRQADALKDLMRGLNLEKSEAHRIKNELGQIQVLVQHQIGGILDRMKATGERRPRGGDQKSKSPAVTLKKAKELKDLGVSKNDASKCTRIATLNKKDLNSYFRETTQSGGEITAAGAERKACEKIREEVHTSKRATPAMRGKYRVWYADPPWEYNDSGVITGSDNYGRAKRHYPTMKLAAISALGDKIKRHCQADAVLFLWVTSPMLEIAFDVIRAWGFKYKTSFVWDKVGHNVGHYNSVRHEFLLLATRGSCTPDNKKLLDSVVTIPKSRRHSEKPEQFRRIIEQLYPRGNRIELFAREPARGWATWGNEP